MNAQVSLCKVVEDIQQVAWRAEVLTEAENVALTLEF